MQLEPNHPFEVLILEETPAEGQTSFAVNTGKIFNFYNPLNYRNVLCDSDGPPLPSLPYSIKQSTPDEQEQSIPDTSFIIDNQSFRIEIYLFCSFKPPENWVAGPSYIPMIEKAWIVCKNYSDPNDISKFTIKGNVRNPSEDNIKFEYYDISDKQTESDKQLGLYEDEINWLGNAINLGPIASLKKTNNIWTVKQFLKENYAFMDFFDSKVFEMCNAEKYDLNVKEVLKTKEKILNSELNANKFKVTNYIRYPNLEELKGYIKYKKDLNLAKFLAKFPEESSRLEIIKGNYEYKFNF